MPLSDVAINAQVPEAKASAIEETHNGRTLAPRVTTWKSTSRRDA